MAVSVVMCCMQSSVDLNVAVCDTVSDVYVFYFDSVSLNNTLCDIRLLIYILAMNICTWWIDSVSVLCPT